MNLQEATAYDELVGRTSTGKPDLLRVSPGNLDESYLIHKLEGREGIVGARMPLASTPLSEAELELIRMWIAGGARR